MAFDRSLFSKVSDSEWETPKDVFDTLSKEFGGFDLDPCATSGNAKCPYYFTKADDGLAQPWRGKVFVNPPYGRTIGDWMRRCYEAVQFVGPYATYNVELVVALVPSSTDTAWWHDYVMEAEEIRFVRRRLKFGGAKTRAPFPSAIVIWRST